MLFVKRVQRNPLCSFKVAGCIGTVQPAFGEFHRSNALRKNVDQSAVVVLIPIEWVDLEDRRLIQGKRHGFREVLPLLNPIPSIIRACNAKNRIIDPMARNISTIGVNRKDTKHFFLETLKVQASNNRSNLVSLPSSPLNQRTDLNWRFCDQLRNTIAPASFQRIPNRNMLRKNLASSTVMLVFSAIRASTNSGLLCLLVAFDLRYCVTLHKRALFLWLSSSASRFLLHLYAALDVMPTLATVSATHHSLLVLYSYPPEDRASRRKFSIRSC